MWKMRHDIGCECPAEYANDVQTMYNVLRTGEVGTAFASGNTLQIIRKQ
jgi:hypothetical protein